MAEPIIGRERELRFDSLPERCRTIQGRPERSLNGLDLTDIDSQKVLLEDMERNAELDICSGFSTENTRSHLMSMPIKNENDRKAWSADPSSFETLDPRILMGPLTPSTELHTFPYLENYPLMKIMMKVSTASGEPIRASEKAYFFFHSELKKALQKPGGSSPLDSIPNFRAIPGIWPRALYQTYKIARDWDEEAPRSVSGCD
jgi:hypothetical protein